MLKKYIVARKEILNERDAASEEEQRTRYATNSNYIFEPLKVDTTTIRRLRDDGHFWRIFVWEKYQKGRLVPLLYFFFNLFKNDKLNI